MLTPKHSGGGPRNYFGNGSDGHIRVTATGALQSFDGTTWTAIPGWELNAADRYAPDAHAEPVVTIPSIEDGDMVVVNAVSLTVDSGVTLTTKYRCRGLLVYTQRDAEINGTLSMTARGCHANPADNSDPAHTPVPPSDGGVVPAEGLIIRRLARGHADTHTGPLLDGCGLDAVNAETNQPEVSGNGVVVAIPRVGGAGGVRVGGGGTESGNPGGSAANGAGGGGSGGWYSIQYNDFAGAGGGGSCFSGGTGGGGNYNGNPVNAEDGHVYGGKGGDGEAWGKTGAGGAGNPGGVSPGGDGDPGQDGTGGLLVLLVGGGLAGSGAVRADGRDGGQGYGANGYASGGSSGGGVAAVLAAGDCTTWTGTLSATGGQAMGLPGYGQGGAGGDGAVIGPIQIDPA